MKKAFTKYAALLFSVIFVITALTACSLGSSTGSGNIESWWNANSSSMQSTIDEYAKNNMSISVKDNAVIYSIDLLSLMNEEEAEQLFKNHTLAAIEKVYKESLASFEDMVTSTTSDISLAAGVQSAASVIELNYKDYTVCRNYYGDPTEVALIKATFEAKSSETIAQAETTTAGYKTESSTKTTAETTAEETAAAETTAEETAAAETTAEETTVQEESETTYEVIEGQTTKTYDIPDESGVYIKAEMVLEHPSGGFTEHLLVVTNKTNETIRIASNSIAKNASGKNIGAASANIDALAPGEEGLLIEYFEETTEAASFETEINYNSTNYYRSPISDLQLSSTVVDKKVIVTCKNTGDSAAKSVIVYALFFEDNDLIAFDYEFFADNDTVIKPGASITKQIPSGAEFDRVELYAIGLIEN